MATGGLRGTAGAQTPSNADPGHDIWCIRTTCDPVVSVVSPVGSVGRDRGGSGGARGSGAREHARTRGVGRAARRRRDSVNHTSGRRCLRLCWR
eukprot:scaffold36160_cov45-Phaeocystis_antarctica.AAC.1